MWSCPHPRSRKIQFAEGWYQPQRAEHSGVPHWQYFMLYRCRPISAEAAVYFAAGKKSSGVKASIKTDHDRAPQVTHKLRQTQFFELVCMERKTASPDTTRKTKSTARHHVGVPLQHALEHACATNKKGVAKQCIMHRKLAAAPTESALREKDAMKLKSGAKLASNCIIATRSH